MAIKNMKLPERFNNWLKVPFITENAGKFLSLVLIVVILWVTIPARLNTPYYHMIDDEDYRAITWIQNNVGDR